MDLYNDNEVCKKFIGTDLYFSLQPHTPTQIYNLQTIELLEK